MEKKNKSTTPRFILKSSSSSSGVSARHNNINRVSFSNDSFNSGACYLGDNIDSSDDWHTAKEYMMGGDNVFKNQSGPSRDGTTRSKNGVRSFRAINCLSFVEV